ncbi:MAG: hypothetical protein R2715_11475 [Ilumatobacteraceae bacterium]
MAASLPPHPFDQLDVGTLRARAGVKWNAFGDDVLGAFVAEMDFGTDPLILSALRDAVDAQRFGYLSDSLANEMSAPAPPGSIASSGSTNRPRRSIRWPMCCAASRSPFGTSALPVPR